MISMILPLANSYYSEFYNLNYPLIKYSLAIYIYIYTYIHTYNYLQICMCKGNTMQEMNCFK